MHLVLFETSGNQRFIFSTNKLRENVGASELTYQAGTRYVLEAIESITKVRLYDQNPGRMRQNLVDRVKNPPIEESTQEVEVIIATSGKALILTKSDSIALDIITCVTARCLREAPGLTIHGVVSQNFHPNQISISKLENEVYDLLERIRAEVPGVDQRFLRLPIVEDCRTSGLPAAHFDENPPDPNPRSTVSISKRTMTSHGVQRIINVCEREVPDVSLYNTIDQIEKLQDLDWLAIIHADGNGLGNVFLNFAELAHTREPQHWREHLNKLRRFSLALDVCAERAFIKALQKLSEKYLQVELKNGCETLAAPVVPLVLGGDDLTVVCHGRYAMNFTHQFIEAFEQETACADPEHFDGIIGELLNRAFGVSYLSICAGVVIMKPHFPFHAGYALAEHLLKSAKIVKRVVKNSDGKLLPCSAVDYHVLYDSSNAEFDRIRGQLTSDHGSTSLIARPYVVTQNEFLTAASEASTKWIKHHRWEELEKRVKAMRARENGERQLPNHVLHDLREGLFRGRTEADARLRLAYTRYQNRGLLNLLPDHESRESASLFWPEIGVVTSVFATGLLDALDIAEFWE